MAETKKNASKAPSKTVAVKASTASVAKKSAVKAPAKAEVKEPAKPAVVTKPVAKAAVKAAVETKPVAKAAVKESSAPVAKAHKATSKASDAHSFSPEYLVLMQKDPNWMQAFWEVNDKRVKAAVKGGSRLVLRLYDVSSDLTVRSHRNRKFRDFAVPADARSWYIENTGKSAQVSLSLGTIDASGSFETIVDSSKMMSFGAEGQFLGGTADDRFLRASLGGVGPGGFGSSQLGLSSQQSFPWSSSLAGSSEVGSSWGSSVSGAGWNQTVPAWQGIGKDFFLWVKTRLIVYGGTRPDAHLQVRGEPFPLNPDGTFSFEQDLPDSTQIIPVFATDVDGDFPTTIVPVVVKRTE